MCRAGEGRAGSAGLHRGQLRLQGRGRGAGQDPGPSGELRTRTRTRTGTSLNPLGPIPRHETA